MKYPATDTTAWDRHIMETAPKTAEGAYWDTVKYHRLDGSVQPLPKPTARETERHIARFGSEGMGAAKPFRPRKSRSRGR